MESKSTPLPKAGPSVPETDQKVGPPPSQTTASTHLSGSTKENQNSTFPPGLNVSAAKRMAKNKDKKEKQKLGRK